ncbi:hypothetical protein COU61_02645 [Candidatus Pacearchaeota archaeon CG10_big_fil_rev_8_21_14_0_10_35_13]|nr:MAG: hypothetical protein COU61_02645 [Candidatus Pacearchaeota archaeon CG10_big_fil_rev_8_21_14_0_10_35_13]
MDEKVVTNVIIEIMGRPKEYIVEALEKVVTQIGTEEQNRIISKEIHEPREIEGKEFFTTYAEIEIEFKGWEQMFAFIFNHMPAHIEVVSPTNVKFQLSEYNNFVNAVLRKLHEYDNVAKSMIIEKGNLEGEMEELKKELGDLMEEKENKNKIMPEE